MIHNYTVIPGEVFLEPSRHYFLFASLSYFNRDSKISDILFLEPKLAKLGLVCTLVSAKGFGTLMTSAYKDNAQGWETCTLVLTYPTLQCKDVGSDSTCLKDALSMGTLVWKVSQILWMNDVE